MTPVSGSVQRVLTVWPRKSWAEGDSRLRKTFAATASLLLTGCCLLAGCGGATGTNPTVPKGTTGPSASASGAADSGAPAPPVVPPSYMPTGDLLALLVPASASPGTTKTDYAAWQGDWGNEDGLAVTLTFVSGDPSCRQLVDDNPMPPATGMAEYLTGPHVNVDEKVASYTSVVIAERNVMDQYVSELKHCKRFVATIYGDRHAYTWTHIGSVVYAKGQPVQVKHQLATTDGSELLDLLDSRIGGEVLSLSLNPDNSGDRLVPRIIATATARFRQRVDAYRSGHPRSA